MKRFWTCGATHKITMRKRKLLLIYNEDGTDSGKRVMGLCTMQVSIPIAINKNTPKHEAKGLFMKFLGKKIRTRDVKQTDVGLCHQI